MRFGVDVSQHQLTWEQLLERVRWAEQAGFEGAWAFDHFKALYGDPKGPSLEAWTVLAALAAATEKIRLGTLVTGVTYRHPSVLAAEAVTVDHVSAGRLELAIGAAWFEEEHRELGIPFPPTARRIEMFEDAIHILKLLMTEDNVSYEGKHFSLDGASYNPRPVQKPHPPLWIGASGERKMLPLVGRFADAWHASGPPDRLAHKWDIVRRSAENAGRDPEKILRSTNLSISEPWDEVEAAGRALVDGGAEYLIVSWPGEGRARVEEFVATVAPNLGWDRSASG